MKKLLIIEPDVFLSDTFSKALEKEFDISTARSAQDAVDVLDTSKIDLIVGDVFLSGNDGVEILHELRSYEDWSKIPLVIVTIVPPADFPVGHLDWKKFGIEGVYDKSKLDPRRLKQICIKLVDAEI